MALAALALAGAAAGCGAPGEETDTVPPADGAVTAVAPATAGPPPSPTTAAAPVPTTALPATTVAPVATTAAVSTTVAGPTTLAPTTVAPTAAPQPAGTVIDLEVTNGRLEGGARREAARLGEEVTIRVSGDSADHVHIHGYDLFLHLTDGTGELVFTADIPGVFEIEMEEAGVTLVQLVVS